MFTIQNHALRDFGLAVRPSARHKPHSGQTNSPTPTDGLDY